MTTNEGQPSSQNPEWEVDKEQNIAIAKRIDALVAKVPNAVDEGQAIIRDSIGDLEEMQLDEEILKRRDAGFTIDNMPEFLKKMSEKQDRLGKTADLKHIDDNTLYIRTGVGYNDEYNDFFDGLFDSGLLPKGFNFPFYLIKRDTSSLPKDNVGLNVTTIHGKSQNNVIGNDGKLYRINNLYCFNMNGQGLKIEEISELGTVEQWFENDEESELARHRFPWVDFTPSEEHSRIVPLTSEDYADINNMFGEIDAGLYKMQGYLLSRQ